MRQEPRERGRSDLREQAPATFCWTADRGVRALNPTRGIIALVRSKLDTDTELDEGARDESAKRHIFGVRRRGLWVIGGEVPQGSIGTAICGAIAMAHGEIRPGLDPPPDPCLECIRIRDEIILKGMGLL